MKKILSLLLAVAVILSSFAFTVSAENDYPIKREDLRIRDPFVLVYDGKYYMYGTCLSRGEGYGCCVSEDLENWSEPQQVFSPDEEFDGYDNYWAPECHYYNGSFYLFATYKSETTQKRGVGIFKSESPLGPFELITDGHATPENLDCIDGTLYIDSDGQPWMVYVNEWTSQPDENGEMAAARLSEDLTEFVSEPIVLFRSNAHLWTNGNVTDGCFMYRTSGGELIMLWSNFVRSGGYAVGIAVSDNGEIDGNWIQHPDALYKENDFGRLNGGHPMIFETLDGEMMMSVHSPNEYSEELFETAQFIPIRDTGNSVSISKTETFDGINSFLIDVYVKLITALRPVIPFLYPILSIRV